MEQGLRLFFGHAFAGLRTCDEVDVQERVHFQLLQQAAAGARKTLFVKLVRPKV